MEENIKKFSRTMAKAIEALRKMRLDKEAEEMVVAAQATVERMRNG